MGTLDAIDGKVASMETEEQFLQFEETGHLKAGVHDCTWEELRRLAFTNDHRKLLGEKLLNFLMWSLRLRSSARVYIGGGFVSKSEFPQDVDLVLETQYPFGPEAFAAMEPFFLRGLDNILSIYSVHLHFWIEGAPRAFMDYRSFFQYHRPQQSDFFETKKRGIVRLSLLSKDFLGRFESVNGLEWNRELDEPIVSRERSRDVRE